MKLKQLVFNSLPRSRSKQKKKLQEKHDQKLKVQQKQISQKESRGRPSPPSSLNEPRGPSSSSSSSSTSPQVKASLNSHQYRIPEEGAAPSPAHPDVNHNQMPLTSSATSSSGTSDKSDAGGCISLPLEKSKRVISRHFNVNLNFNTDGGDTKCACYKHLKPLDSPVEDLSPHAPSGGGGQYYNLSSSSMGDSGFNSLPKTRTRIKTNPWLPSPRSTPSTSPDLSPMASSSSSPVYCERRSFDSSDCHTPRVDSSDCHTSKVDSSDCHTSRVDSSDCHTSRVDSSNCHNPWVTAKHRRDNIYEEITTLNINPQNCLSKKKFCDSFSAGSTDSDSVLQRSLLSETDNTGTDILVTTDTNSASEKNMIPDNTAKPTAPPHPHPPHHHHLHHPCHQKQLEDQYFESPDLDRHVNFDYEEAFESQLEARGVGQYVGSRDDLSEGSDDDLFNDPLGSRAHDFDSEYCPSNYDSSCNEYTSETETDDTVCDDYYTETGLRRGGRPTHFNDVFRDYYHYADDEEEEKEESDDGFSLGSHPADLYQEEYVGQGRSLGQVRLSLQDKVNRLRRDKFIVDEKIQVAREEERLRIQEKMRFQKQMTLARKRLLLQTLQDLKDKLESQSERLQQTYSAVLSMQQAVISNRKQALQRPPLAIVNTREAPF